MESRNVVHEKYSKNEQLVSHQALRKSRGSDKHCPKFCVVTCWKCSMKKNIRNNKADIKKKWKNWIKSERKWKQWIRMKENENQMKKK